jgi:hypothetical protein
MVVTYVSVVGCVNGWIVSTKVNRERWHALTTAHLRTRSATYYFTSCYIEKIGLKSISYIIIPLSIVVSVGMGLRD